MDQRSTYDLLPLTHFPTLLEDLECCNLINVACLSLNLSAAVSRSDHNLAAFLGCESCFTEVWTFGVKSSIHFATMHCTMYTRFQRECSEDVFELML